MESFERLRRGAAMGLVWPIAFALALVLAAGCAQSSGSHRVDFTGPAGRLAGSLFSPPAFAAPTAASPSAATSSPHSPAAPGRAVVIVPDAGPLDRDGIERGKGLRPPHAHSLLGHSTNDFPLYGELARRLADSGATVLIYDKRGVGGSAGAWIGASVDDLAADAQAALQFLKTRPGVDPRRVGYVGHGQGGWAAARAAAKGKDAAFLVLLGCSSMAAPQQLMTEIENEARADGLRPGHVNEALEFTLRSMAAIQSKDSATLEKLTAKAAESDWADLLPAISPAQRAAYLRPLLDYDPAPDFAAAPCPVLAAFGGLDAAAPPPRNIQRLRAIFEKGGRAEPAIRILPTANHQFVPARTGGQAEWHGLEKRLDPLLPDLLDEWVGKR